MTATIIPFPDRTGPRPAAVAQLHFEALWDQSEAEWFRQAVVVLDAIEAMLDHRPDEVVSLCQQAIRCLLDAAPEIEDGDAVLALIDRLRDVHLRGCRATSPDPVALAGFVYELAHSDEMGVLHGIIDPYASLLGEQGIAELRRLLEADERRLRGTTGIVRSLLELGLRPIHTSLARLEHPSGTGCGAPRSTERTGCGKIGTAPRSTSSRR